MPTPILTYNAPYRVYLCDTDLSTLTVLPALDIGAMYIWEAGKKVFIPCFTSTGEVGIFTPYGGTDSIPPSQGFQGTLITTSQTLAPNINYITQNTSSITLTLPTAQTLGATISILTCLNSAQITISTSSTDVIIPPNSQAQTVGYTTGVIPAGVVSPVTFTYVPNVGQWLQSGPGTLTFV